MKFLYARRNVESLESSIIFSHGDYFFIKLIENLEGTKKDARCLVTYVNARKKKWARHTEVGKASLQRTDAEDGKMGERKTLPHLRGKIRSPFSRLFFFSPVPFFPPVSIVKNLPHPRESFRRMKTLLFMRHVQARREFSRKGTAPKAFGCTHPHRAYSRPVSRVNVFQNSPLYAIRA